MNNKDLKPYVWCGVFNGKGIYLIMTEVMHIEWIPMTHTCPQEIKESRKYQLWKKKQQQKGGWREEINVFSDIATDILFRLYCIL